MALARLAGLAAPLLRSRSMAGVDSRPVCSGGVVTEYVGDGVNGTLGQRYRVHTLEVGVTQFVVTEGGTARVLLVSASRNVVGSDGGAVAEFDLVLSRGVYVVKVGTYTTSVLDSATRFGAVGILGCVGASSYGAGTWRADVAGGSEGVWSSITGKAIQHGGGNGTYSNADSRGAGNQPGSLNGSGVVVIRYEI